MKVRLYVDVPPYIGEAYSLFASTIPHTGSLPDGYKRVAIDVDLPCRRYDECVDAQVIEESE